MTRSYTGVGSRNITDAENKLIQNVAYYLCSIGYEVRSGKAGGSDTSFALGALKALLNGYSDKIINFVPWSGFKNEELPSNYDFFNTNKEHAKTAMELASEIHPNWDACSRAAKELHTRNVFQVLGKDLDKPSLFLLACASEDKYGDVTGGTRTAWMVAKRYGVLVFNIRGRSKEDLWRFLKTVFESLESGNTRGVE